ncbi:MAG: bacteriohemerythrin [Gammaproteobacteria bacterium]|nr:bacteriohemerythrin [Gammaproteobacteria bacterium]MBU2676203.1 bacteriohemerythrin [Gammaproteobacteria bacterium]NNL49939.1 hemerythrin family protein [Woeseiaceae bacterium]
MSLIEWRDEFSVGVASVDLEHRELIDLINDLHALLGDNASADAVVSMLGEIFAQISAHFALEEKYMRDTRYPLLDAHKADHENLLDELRDIMELVDIDGNYNEQALSENLQRWFTEHFRTHDAKLHQLGH